MDQGARKGGILKGSKGAMNNNAISMSNNNGDACSISSMHSISTQASVYAPTFNPAIKPTSDWYDTINDSDTSMSLPPQTSNLATAPANLASNLAPNDSNLGIVPPNVANLPPTLNPNLSSNSSNFSGTVPRQSKPSNDDIPGGYFSDASSTNSSVRNRLKPRLFSHLKASHLDPSISEESPKPPVIVNLPFKERNFNFDFENISLTSTMGVQAFEDVYGHPSTPIASGHMSRPIYLNDRYQSHTHQYGGHMPHTDKQSTPLSQAPTLTSYQSHGGHTPHTGEQLTTPSQAPTPILTPTPTPTLITSHNIVNLRRTSSTSGDSREMGASLDDNNSIYMSSKARSIVNSSVSTSNLSAISTLEASLATSLKVSKQNSSEQSIDLSIEETSTEGSERQGSSFEKALKMGAKGTFLLCIPKGICMPEGNVKTICPSSIDDYDSMNVKDCVKSLWADAYQPTSFDAFLCHMQQAQLLRQLLSHGNCPHIFFDGLSTYGKKSLIMALLQEIFGPTSWKVSQEKKEFTIKGEKKVSIHVVASKFHVELDAEDLAGNSRAILLGLFKEITQSMESSRVIDIDADYETNFRVIVLYRIDKLSNDTQQVIRWLMDRYGDTCKLLLCSDHANNVLDSVKSRCQTLTVDPPSQQEMVTVLQHIAGREKMRVSLQFIMRIANESNQNLRHAIESLEACNPSIQGQAVREDLPIPTGWEDGVAELAMDILLEQTPKRMFAARNKLQSLLRRHVPPQLLLQSLVIELLKKLNFHLKKEICYWHGLYEKRLSSTSSAIDKLEEFVAKIMSIYRKYKKATLSEAK